MLMNLAEMLALNLGNIVTGHHDTGFDTGNTVLQSLI
jgi:hypothetical protein